MYLDNVISIDKIFDEYRKYEYKLLNIRRQNVPILVDESVIISLLSRNRLLQNSPNPE